MWLTWKNEQQFQCGNSKIGSYKEARADGACVEVCWCICWFTSLYDCVPFCDYIVSQLSGQLRLPKDVLKLLVCVQLWSFQTNNTHQTDSIGFRCDDSAGVLTKFIPLTWCIASLQMIILHKNQRFGSQCSLIYGSVNCLWHWSLVWHDILSNMKPKGMFELSSFAFSVSIKVHLGCTITNLGSNLEVYACCPGCYILHIGDTHTFHTHVYTHIFKCTHVFITTQDLFVHKMHKHT